ncbi:MAG: hypothetical protein QOE96_3756 [Blastocatellia bacterium]|jgi:hypothetical protein|nr:hypothetical protein [Blastocatellia bacterium]
MTKNFISRIGLLVLVALFITSILSFTARAAHGNRNHNKAAIQANITFEAIQERAEVPEALLSSRHVFQPRFQASYTVPNFGRVIRRAPIRRKGRIQH